MKHRINLTNDIAFKKMLENEIALKSILQTFLPLPPGSTIEEIVQGEDETRPHRLTSPQRKTFILDLKVVFRRREGNHLYPPETVNVEIQTSREKHFANRLLAYASRLYSEQLKRGESFSKLYPVYSLAFTTVNLPEFAGVRDFFHKITLMREETPHRIFVKGVNFLIVELEKFVAHPDNFVDKKDIWCYLLKNFDKMKAEELDVIRGKGEDMKYVVEHLEELSEDEYTQAEIEAFDKQQKIQWSKEELAWDEGRNEGMEKKQKEIALNLLKAGADIQMICKCTGLTEKEIWALQEKKR